MRMRKGNRALALLVVASVLRFGSPLPQLNERPPLSK